MVVIDDGGNDSSVQYIVAALTMGDNVDSFIMKVKHRFDATDPVRGSPVVIQHKPGKTSAHF